VAFAAQFQVQIFWVGLLFNAAGIVYIATLLFKASKEHAHCVA
jgi:P-type Cu+ transporter